MPPLRFYEIAESGHRIQNPFSEAKLMLLGEVCRLTEGMRLLDLACGKGELLARWANAYGILGVGIDISEVFTEAAKERAYMLDVSDQLNFIEDDAADYPQSHHQFDMVTCLGASFLGGGLIGTLELMQTALKPRKGKLVIGEPYWHLTPPDEVLKGMGAEPEMYTTLSGLLNRFESLGAELVEMVVSSPDDWDRYRGQQWASVVAFLEDNPDDPDAEALYDWMSTIRRRYMTYERDYMGWGTFVLRI